MTSPMAVSLLMKTLAMSFLSLGCESVALIGRPTLPPGVGFEEVELLGQVEGIEPGEKSISIKTREGERRKIFYNPDTQVLVKGREYPITSLRVGDSVALQLLKDPQGKAYTDLVRVRTVSPDNESQY